MRSYDLEPLKPIPQLDLDDTGLTPERIALRLREYWMMPRGPVGNLAEIIEQGGAVIVPVRFDTNLLDGLSFRQDGLPPLIFVNPDVPGDRWRFSLTHELVHLVMHTVATDDERMEEEANRFAAEFLMPAQDIRSYLTTVKLSTLGRVKAYWKVSIKSLIKRAHDLKLVTDHYYKVLNIQYNKSFSQGEPIRVDPDPPTLLGDMIRHHTSALGYSIAELAELLCLTEAETDATYSNERQIRLVVSN